MALRAMKQFRSNLSLEAFWTELIRLLAMVLMFVSALFL